MEWIIALIIGVIFAAGILALQRGSRIHLVVGLILLSQAVNLTVFTAAGLQQAEPPILTDGPTPENIADPLPQALVLTAIVISLGVNAYLLALLVRESRTRKSHHKEEPFE
jgi:multicomponent Na+:H+ antiporter subunit C